MTCYVNLPLMRSINDMTSYLETLKCGDRLFFLPTLINYYTTSPVIKETNGVDFFFFWCFSGSLWINALDPSLPDWCPMASTVVCSKKRSPYRKTWWLKSESKSSGQGHLQVKAKYRSKVTTTYSQISYLSLNKFQFFCSNRSQSQDFILKIGMKNWVGEKPKRNWDVFMQSHVKQIKFLTFYMLTFVNPNIISSEIYWE